MIKYYCDSCGAELGGSYTYRYRLNSESYCYENWAEEKGPYIENIDLCSKTCIRKYIERHLEPNNENK